jgi:trans-2,3-dihydro-3-hydroxyanthranilate isomerase
MSRTYRFRVVNVFAQSRLSGNPLAVFEDGTGLTDSEMQQLALQFNLAEITFLLPSKIADAHVRIFTPTFEMPFAGHPTLGTAHVLRALGRAGDQLRLEMGAGVIPVRAQGDTWTLTANAPTQRAYEFSRAQVALALGLNESDVVADPVWMNAGVEQLLVPLASEDAVARATPELAAFRDYCRNAREAHAYVFAHGERGQVAARYFWYGPGVIAEDPGTGSACANLGAYLLLRRAKLPIRLQVDQGAATGRPCVLHLHVDSDEHIHVGGHVIELIQGQLQLD